MRMKQYEIIIHDTYDEPRWQTDKNKSTIAKIANMNGGIMTNQIIIPQFYIFHYIDKIYNIGR